MAIYHFSEDAHIRVFTPHVAPTSAVAEPLVWAIGEWHQVMYFFPRDCPRACFWAGERTTDEDRERLLGPSGARMVIAIESAWLDRIRSARLYRYTMPEENFEGARGDDSGHRISREAVTPLSVEPMPDLLAALVAENVELRIMPSLVDLWKAVIQSSLQFSGTRLRNAQGWSDVDWDAIPPGIYAMPKPNS
jgi:hypothetical protein